MNTQDQINTLENTQREIFRLSEKADSIINSFGSMKEVKNILTDIRKMSMDIMIVVSNLETPEEIPYDDQAEEFHINPALEELLEDDEPKSLNGECQMGYTAVKSFFAGCEKIYKDAMDRDFPNGMRDSFRMTQGRRYIKVIRGGSVHCFIDRTNGDVLKAASWSAPARHKRGNIWDDDNGLNCMSEYGAAYLRG